MSNCLTCARYASCADPKKGRQHLCGDYQDRVLDDRLLFGHVPGEDDAKALQLIEERRAAEMNQRELNLEQIVDDILSSKSIVPRDYKIDDSDLPDFKNVYDFVFNERYPLGIELFPRQMWMGVMLFSDWCPRCSHPSAGKIIPHPHFDAQGHDQHVIPVDGSGRDLVEWVQLLEHGVCPKCSARRSELWKAGELNVYNELAAVIGQRAGKSTTTAVLDAYPTARLLKMQKPTAVYPGVARNTTLMGTMVALRFQDAYDLLWTPFKDTINDSLWFQEYHKLMKHYNNKYGQELFKELDTYIKYGHRNMHLYPSGPNKRTLRGRTRFLANIDEYGWFDSDPDSDSKERTSAVEVYDALNASLSTLRNGALHMLQRGYDDIPTAIAMNISSPSSTDDEIMTLVRNNQHSRTIFAVHLPTWSVNPIMTREALQPEFDKNYSRAMRNFAAIPPESSNPFFSPTDPLQPAFGRLPTLVSYKPHRSYDANERLKSGLQLLDIGHSQLPHLIALDAGQSRNSFALTLLGLDRKADVGEGRLKFTALIECQPAQDAPIDFAWMRREVIAPLIRPFNVRGIFADRWQSLMMLDELQEEFKDMNLYTQVYSVKYRDFLDFKSYVTGGGAWFPELGVDNPHMVEMNLYPSLFEGFPAWHLFFQCRRSVDRGVTVEKGPKVTDDLLRACVLGTHWALDERWIAKYMHPLADSTVAGRSVGGYVGRSGGLSNFGGRMSPTQRGTGSAQGSTEGRITVVGRSSYR